MSASNLLLAPVKGAERREIGGVQMEVVRAGSGRVKRVIYRPGFRWSKDMKGIVGTDLCMHAHVDSSAARYTLSTTDGCRLEFSAPQVVAIEPGHDGWVVGNEPAVLVEVDFEGETARRFGMPDDHRHGGAGHKGAVPTA